MWDELLATLREIAGTARTGSSSSPGPVARSAPAPTCPAGAATSAAQRAPAGVHAPRRRRGPHPAPAARSRPSPRSAASRPAPGANMAFGCDLIVASDDARFTEIFARRGLTIDFGGSWLLPRLIGLHKAKELAFFADIISAKEAEAFGLVNRVVPAGELDAFVDDWASEAGHRSAHRAGPDEAPAQQLHGRHPGGGARRRRGRPDGQLRHARTPRRPWRRSSRSAIPASRAADRLIA